MEAEAPTESEQIKRKRGRPKGSKNKKTLERERLQNEPETAQDEADAPVIKKVAGVTCGGCEMPLQASVKHYHTQDWYSGKMSICCDCAKKLKPNWKCKVID